MVNMTRISIRAIHLSKESTTDSLRKQSKKFRKEAEDDNEDRVFLREQMVDTTRIGIPGRANYLSEDFQQPHHLQSVPSIPKAITRVVNAHHANSKVL